MLLMAAIIVCPAIVKAQMPQMPSIPVDTAVVMGKLPNGLTYYIRHNEYPKGQADFHIAQRVGSILENEKQLGLAHFLEHMCFNGTKSFPGNSLVSWLESVGIKFGAHLNASTGFDKTVYKITNVPTASTGIQDSVLLILHDWANDLLLEPEEIDKERGVIHEEWRSRNTGQQRILTDLLPRIYQGERYGSRMPIGTMEIVDNFPYQDLRDYYEMWYRPDQQGIIIVGDIDPKRIEAKIKEMFSDIEMPANAPERVYYPVSDNPGTIYAIGADKEQSNALVFIDFKSDATPAEIKSSQMYLLVDYCTTMISRMLNARFQEMQMKPDCPFAIAQASIGDFWVSKTKESLQLVGAAKDGDILPVASSIYREFLRAKRGGFTTSEYDRAREEYLSSLEKTYNNRNNTENARFVKQYIDNFTDNEPMPAIDWLYPQMKQFASMIPVDQINMALQQIQTDSNRVVVAMLPAKDGVNIPTEAQLAQVLEAVDAEEIEVFVDNVKSEPLIASLPTPGKIVKETANQLWGTTEWTLSNGVKVIVKNTKFKEDEIVMAAAANQGLSRVLNSISPASFLSLDIMAESFGIGSYTDNDLKKYLSGKQVSLAPSFSMYSRRVNGSTTPRDLRSLLELTYGMFTDFNMEASEFEAAQAIYSGMLKNQELNPQAVFLKDVYKSLFTSPYRQMLTADDVNAANRDEMLKAMRSQLANAADYTFTFVGNVNIDSLRPLVEQYIATLPANAKTATKAVKKAIAALEPKAGLATDNYTTKMESPQTWVMIYEGGNMKFTSRDAKLALIAGQILSARLIATVREKESAVYSISAQGSLGTPEGMNAAIQSAFPMKPEMKEKVLSMIKAEFTDMEANVTDEELNKVKEFMIKSYTEGKERNSAWLNAICTFVLDGVDTFNGNIDTVKAITPADVQKFMKALNSQNNYRVVILDPEK